MEKFYNGSKSRNDKSDIFFKNISSYTSETLFDNNNYILNNGNYNNKKYKNSINISTDKINNNDSTIYNHDIRYIINENIMKKNKSQTNTNFYNNNLTKSNNILENYIIRLQNFGFPEIGEIFLSSDTREQEKTFNFFDYIITKETNNLEKNHIKEKEYNEYKNKYVELEDKLIKINREFINNIKISKNIQKDLENKLISQKNFYEQKLSLLMKDNEYLTYVNNKIYYKKKNLELKLYSMNKTINKFEDMKSNLINAVEEIDYMQNNDMAKMLTRVKGAEKLIEGLKAGYNESLKQLASENSSMKNLIFEIHNDIYVLLDNPQNIDKNVYDMTFKEKIEYYKNVFKNNIRMLKEKIQMIGMISRQDSLI